MLWGQGCVLVQRVQLCMTGECSSAWLGYLYLKG